MNTSFFEDYMDYVDLANQECPAIYHRWSLASAIGTLLGRQFYMPFGKGIDYPNQYIILMGPPGARKGTAMKVSRRILKLSGYNRFGPDRTSLERFLKEFKQFDIDPTGSIDGLEALSFDDPAEQYAYAEELVGFLGLNNIDFCNLLTDLWDNKDQYTHPKMQSKDISVHKPTVNLFGAATPGTFAMAVPPEAISTGFTSRIIFVHSDGSGRQIPFPPEDDVLLTEGVALQLRTIKEKVRGPALVGLEARKLLEQIYKNTVPIDDSRFMYYQDRRYTHLRKLSMVLAASELRTEILAVDILRANTMLAMAERFMPRALGEFGKSRNAGAANEILTFLGRRNKPADAREIWGAVSRTVSKIQELQEILHNLKVADKIQTITLMGKTGYMTKHVETPAWKEEFLDINWLTAEERI